VTSRLQVKTDLCTKPSTEWQSLTSKKTCFRQYLCLDEQKTNKQTNLGTTFGTKCMTGYFVSAL
jgi:hypothetical protein